MKKLNKRIDRAAMKAKDVATRVADNVIDGAATIVKKAENVVESAAAAAARAGNVADSAAEGLQGAKVSMARTRRALGRMKR